MNALSFFKKMTLIATVSFVSSLALAAAQPTVKFGKAQFSGAGCPQGKATFTPSPDGTTFSILFDEFAVETDKPVDYKYCTLLVPVTVAKGYKFKIESIDYRGFVDLDQKAVSQIGSYPMFVNAKSQAIHGGWKLYVQRGQMTDNFTETLSLASMPDSYCGGTTQYLVLHNIVSVYNFNAVAGRISGATLDSLDGSGLLKAKLKHSACK